MFQTTLSNSTISLSANYNRTVCTAFRTLILYALLQLCYAVHATWRFENSSHIVGRNKRLKTRTNRQFINCGDKSDKCKTAAKPHPEYRVQWLGAPLPGGLSATRRGGRGEAATPTHLATFISSLRKRRAQFHQQQQRQLQQKTALMLITRCCHCHWRWGCRKEVDNATHAGNLHLPIAHLFLCAVPVSLSRRNSPVMWQSFVVQRKWKAQRGKSAKGEDASRCCGSQLRSESAVHSGQRLSA